MMMIIIIFKPLWPCRPTRAMSTSFTRFLDHTQQPITVRTPLDEWSARHSDFYLTTHNTHNKRPFLGGIRTHNLSKRAAADLRLRLCGALGYGKDIIFLMKEHELIIWNKLC